MRIGITCYPTYGGSGVVATELGIELAALGHEVHFISYSQPFRLNGRDDGIFYHEVPVSNYPLFEFPPYDLALASRMAEVAEYYSLDLLHVHYAIPHSVSALLARQMLATRGRRLPFVTTLHGTDITLVGLDRSYLAHHAPRHSGERRRYQHFQLSARQNHRRFRRHAAHRDHHQLCQLRCLHADQRRGASARAAARTSPRRTKRILMHLSNFRPVKRVTDVVKIFALVARERPAQLVLIGDGPDRSAAEWLAHDLGIQARVHFLGKQERVSELLALADLLLMPSELESFGLAALEAMACKVPSIATRVGGVPELIDDGVTGLLYPVGDVDAMAAGALSLLNDPSRLEAMREAARKTRRSASAPRSWCRNMCAITSRFWGSRAVWKTKRHLRAATRQRRDCRWRNRRILEILLPNSSACGISCFHWRSSMKMGKSLALVAVCAPVLLWAQAAGGPFDGTWTTNMSCDASEHMPAYTWTFVSTITNGTFHGQHGEEGGPGYMVIDGTIGADGSAKLHAKGTVSGGESGPDHSDERQQVRLLRRREIHRRVGHGQARRRRGDSGPPVQF